MRQIGWRRALPGHRAALVWALAAASLGVTGLGVQTGCGSDGGAAASSDAGTPETETTVTLYPDASPLPGESECKVVMVTNIAVPKAGHLPVCTPVTYATNPPSGGPHWGVWAAFKEFATPVPREVYVHDLEHGAVVLGYRCDGECPEVVEALHDVFAASALDPLCATQPTAARMVVTPDPDLPAPIAAAAWGATYVATCIDEPSLKSFVAEVYGKGTEATCAQGQIADPATIVCGDAGAEGGSGGEGGGGAASSGGGPGGSG